MFGPTAILLAAIAQPATASVTQAAPPTDISGTYIDDIGGRIVIAQTDGKLTLQSGPSTFTLKPAGGGRYAAVERDLVITISDAGLTVAEAGNVVARAKRGEATPPPPAAQGERLPAWLDANIPQLLKRYRVPGAAIGYVSNGRVAWTRVYGERRRGVPADTRTLFNIASLTKPIAAETLLRLASAKRLDLDAPMASAYIDPDIAGDSRAAKLTVRMALLHRTGLPNWRSQTGNTLQFGTAPGERFRYAGEGYTYAARYAERVTGTGFEELTGQLVLAPMGMRDTYFTVASAYKARAAYPHDGQGRELWPVLRLDFSAACCVHTTIGDYTRFVAGVMEDSRLSPEVAAQRFATAPDRRPEFCGGEGGLPMAICPPRIAMGLGWFVEDFPGGTVITHTGINDGERSAAFFVPAKKFGVVILTNGANGTKLIRDITYAAYDDPDYRKLVDYLAR